MYSCSCIFSSLFFILNHFKGCKGRGGLMISSSLCCDFENIIDCHQCLVPCMYRSVQHNSAYNLTIFAVSISLISIWWNRVHHLLEEGEHMLHYPFILPPFHHFLLCCILVSSRPKVNPRRDMAYKISRGSIKAT